MSDSVSLKITDYPINSVSMDRSGTIVSCACDDSFIYIIDINENKLLTKVSGHQSSIQVFFIIIN